MLGLFYHGTLHIPYGIPIPSLVLQSNPARHLRQLLLPLPEDWEELWEATREHADSLHVQDGDHNLIGLVSVPWADSNWKY